MENHHFLFQNQLSLQGLLGAECKRARLTWRRRGYTDGGVEGKVHVTYFEVLGKLDDFLERKERVVKKTLVLLKSWDMEPELELTRTE